MGLLAASLSQRRDLQDGDQDSQTLRLCDLCLHQTEQEAKDFAQNTLASAGPFQNPSLTYNSLNLSIFRFINHERGILFSIKDP